MGSIRYQKYWFHAVSVAGCLGILLPAAAYSEETEAFQQAKKQFKPLPKDMAMAEAPLNPAQVELGRKLFFDPRLSTDGTASCATCHKPSLYATDTLSKSIGVGHKPNQRNAPTVFNAALQFRAHWAGERASVEEQAMMSLTGPASFGNPNYDAVVRRIGSIPGYSELFARAFPKDAKPIRPENWGKALGAYERTLVTPSPFDSFLTGNPDALGADAKEGLGTFIRLGCASCHNGVAVGGNSFRKFGILADYWKETGSKPVDEGRFTTTHDAADKYVFKVAGLRNVAMTPPYFHDGSVASLKDAVRIMAKVQLGQNLMEQQISTLIAFLNTLTGQPPEDFVREPILAPKAFKEVTP